VLVCDAETCDHREVRGTILVAEPTPRSADHAINRVRSGGCHGVVLSDDPVSVAAALRACLDGWVLFCERALELANSLPPLSSEQQ
jgi:hypothetical protein